MSRRPGRKLGAAGRLHVGGDGLDDDGGDFVFVLLEDFSTAFRSL